MEIINRTKNIVICSGAGVSTNSGIPDYRSSNGVFARLLASNKYPVNRPEELFSRYFVQSHPEIYQDEIYLNFLAQISSAQPTMSHQLAKILNDRGKLLRVITQNVDGLYQKTGLPEEKIIEFHGSLIKNTMVLYGDTIFPGAKEAVLFDMLKCDCLIVMGTSLQVSPFCAIPNLVRKNVPRFLVDKCPENSFQNSWNQMGGTISFGHKRVNLASTWNQNIYLDHIFERDCDQWSKAMIS